MQNRGWHKTLTGHGRGRIFGRVKGLCERECRLCERVCPFGVASPERIRATGEMLA